MSEPFENTCDIHQERRAAVSAVAKQPVTVDTVVVTLRLSRVHLLAYIGGMDFDTEFSNLNGTYLKTVNSRQTRLESRQCKLLLHFRVCPIFHFHFFHSTSYFHYVEIFRKICRGNCC